MSRLQVQVVAPMQRLLTMGGYIGAQVVLVGRLIVRESRVAIKAVRAVLHRQVCYRRVKRGYLHDGLLHPLFKVRPDGVILLFMFQVPLPVIVFRQLAQVLQYSFCVHIFYFNISAKL